MNMNSLFIDTDSRNENLISGYDNRSKFIRALDIYLQNEFSEYYMHNNLEKIFNKAQNDHDLQAKLMKSLNKFIVM